MAMGRPRKEINWEEMQKLCQILATKEEIADWFDCSMDTIELNVKREYNCTFTQYYRHHSSQGKISLRRKQMQMALDGNQTLLMWLGKQILGQTEKVESRTETLDLNRQKELDVIHEQIKLMFQDEPKKLGEVIPFKPQDPA